MRRPSLDGSGRNAFLLKPPVSRIEEVLMLELTVPTGRPLPAGSLRTHTDGPILGPLCTVSRTIAFIAHDLRQPLTAILANAEFLTEGNISAAERDFFFQEIRSSVDRMNELVGSLVECSRGRDTLQPGARNIVDTVARVVRMTAVKREFRHISIEHHHEGLAVGWFDSSRLERAIANLVVNACEAVSPDFGKVVIRTTGYRACLQMNVWDSGPGVPQAIRDSVFQPFVSCGKATGSGLGLAIAKKIVEDHGGKIHLDGRRENGTSFTISLPFAIPEAGARSQV
jgi:signal transduction histidine kinase